MINSLTYTLVPSYRLPAANGEYVVRHTVASGILRHCEYDEYASVQFPSGQIQQIRPELLYEDYSSALEAADAQNEGRFGKPPIAPLPPPSEGFGRIRFFVAPFVEAYNGRVAVEYFGRYYSVPISLLPADSRRPQEGDIVYLKVVNENVVEMMLAGAPTKS